MAFAAIDSAVKINATGITTAFTAESCSLVSGHTYQIDNAAKRCWDPSQTLTVYVSGSPVTPDAVDYLFGRVRLLSSPGGPVTVSGSYLPMLAINTAKSFSLDVTVDIVDVTVFSANSRAHQKQPVLFDATFSIDAIDTSGQLFEDNSEAPEEPDTFFGTTTRGNLKVIEFVHTQAQRSRRMACYLNKDNVKASASSVVETSVAGALTRLAAGVDISFSEFMVGGYF